MISSVDEVFHEIVEYSPPEWCNNLRGTPKYRIPLAMKPTPIHPWRVEGLPEGVTLHVKRDDMTGSILSGNKCRKLEFLLAEAKSSGCGSVITSGSLFSNHCRTTLYAAKLVGLDCYLVQRDPNEGQEKTDTELPSGNLLLIRIADPTTYILPWEHFSDDVLRINMNKLADHILKTTGKPSYIIPAGGSDEIGMHGYLYAWEEMIQQKVLDNFDDVVVTCGSVGTSKSLAIANYLTGSKVRVHGLSVSRPLPSLHNKIEKGLKAIGLENIRSKDIIDICDYVGEGYSRYNMEHVEFCKKVTSSTGVYCDPIYVGKALKGLLHELKTNPGRFQGKRILFIHTGGLFGMMENATAGMFQDLVQSRTCSWKELFPDDS